MRPDEWQFLFAICSTNQGANLHGSQVRQTKSYATTSAGDVGRPGGGGKKPEDQPHAVGHAERTPMPGHIEAQRQKVPVTARQLKDFAGRQGIKLASLELAAEILDRMMAKKTSSSVASAYRSWLAKVACNVLGDKLAFGDGSNWHASDFFVAH